MKSIAMLLAVAIAAVATIAASQEAATSAKTAPAAETSSSVTANGEIVRYDAGKTIVLRQSDDRVVTWTLSPTLAAPADVRVGHRVTVFVEPDADGIVRVSRITNTAPAAMPPAAPASEAKTQVTTVYGTVTAYEPGRSLTVVPPGGSAVTYAIDGSSAVPGNLATGRRVVVGTTTRPGLDRPIVRKVKYSRR